jgi:hypothetical protein
MSTHFTLYFELLDRISDFCKYNLLLNVALAKELLLKVIEKRDIIWKL